jgi:hypothetical protein
MNEALLDPGADAKNTRDNSAISTRLQIDPDSCVTIDRRSSGTIIGHSSDIVDRGSESQRSTYLFSSQRGSNAFGSQRESRAFRSREQGSGEMHDPQLSVIVDDPRHSMKLYSVAPETDVPEHSTRYKGRLRRWPGATLILVFVLAVVAASIAAGLHYSKKSDTRVNEFIKKEQRRRAIQDGLIPYDDLVDADGQVNNPVSYVSISSSKFMMMMRRRTGKREAKYNLVNVMHIPERSIIINKNMASS